MQRELIPRVGVNVGYFRRWYGNFVRHRQPRASRRRTSTRSAWPLPADPRLPDGGGNTLTGLYNVDPGEVRA